MLPTNLNSMLSLRKERETQQGKQADLIILDIPDYRHIPYHFGVNHVFRVIKKGRLVWESHA